MTGEVTGLPNLVFIPSAMPGRRESGRCWEITFDAFLLRHGFKRNIYDLHSFIHIRKGAFLYILARRRHPRIWDPPLDRGGVFRGVEA